MTYYLALTQLGLSPSDVDDLCIAFVAALNDETRELIRSFQ